VLEAAVEPIGREMQAFGWIAVIALVKLQHLNSTFLVLQVLIAILDHESLPTWYGKPAFLFPPP
jgi:hypothetical protein